MQNQSKYLVKINSTYVSVKTYNRNIIIKNL